jgi:hypothetical protein
LAGINIDFVTEKIGAFNQYRSHDHNAIACVSDAVVPVEITHSKFQARIG